MTEKKNKVKKILKLVDRSDQGWDSGFTEDVMSKNAARELSQNGDEKYQTHGAGPPR